MHCLRCSVRFQVDIFVPTSEDNLGHFHPDGANLKMQTHFVPTMMCQKSCPNFLAAVLWQNLFCSIGPSGLNWVENNFPIFYYLHTHHTYQHTHPPTIPTYIPTHPPYLPTYPPILPSFVRSLQWKLV